jgi:hypothetical protein
MAWETFKSDDGTYLVNWEALTRIFRSSARYGAIAKIAKVTVTEKHVIGPDLYSVTVDWEKVRNDTDVQTHIELRTFHTAAKRSMQSELNRVASVMDAADKNRDKFQKMLQEAQQTTMKNIETSVKNNEMVVRGLTVVRDGCADFVMVGATYLTGGTAGFLAAPAWAPSAAVAASSLMKGGFAYQDTGKVRDAVATFSTNLLLGLGDLKVAASIAKHGSSKAERLAMTILWSKVKGVLDVPKSLIEGKHVNDAMSSGVVKSAAAAPVTAGVEQLKSILESREMSAWAIPVEVTLNMLQDKGGEMLAKAAESTAPPKPALPIHRSERLMDSVIYDRSILDKSAVRKVAPPTHHQQHRPPGAHQAGQVWRAV